jgi:hypothetical protein
MYHHYQPINVPTAEVQTGTERAINHHACPVRMQTTANAARTTGLACLRKQKQADEFEIISFWSPIR